MFWSKKTIESAEFQKLFSLFNNLRVEVESLKLDVELYKKKLKVRAGILKDEDKKDPYGSVLLPEE